MKKTASVILLLMLVVSVCFSKDKRNSFYVTNQAPLAVQPYTALPLGAVKAKGMLLKMLETQRDGLTGQLDKVYSVVCGSNNGWLGGNGDGWERGPYWIDGLIPLAYILDDENLKKKAQEWIEWSIKNQREDGYFGPRPLVEGYKVIPGTQQGNREDWWPKMVMLKALQQYYSATGDERVLRLMTGYFKYQQKMLPQYPLGHWTFWGEQRGADNLAVVYWLYNITGDKFLLDLAEMIHKQTFDWITIYSGNALRKVNPLPDLHCVNVAQGLKAPVIYYQQHPEKKYLDAVKLGLSALREIHGTVNGMYGADEMMHGNDPTQGSELCSAIEMMFSFESILPVTGDVYYADYLEKIAYNVIPTQTTDDYMRKQYFQQANQVLITDVERNFFNDRNARICYGTTSGYPCCLTNMHQGWPKFIQNLWYATNDNGIAALVYGPSEATVKVADGQEVTVTEITEYPFREKIQFIIRTDRKVAFPFHLRIPLWCKSAAIKVNDRDVAVSPVNNIAVINREWSSGDVVELDLGMDFRFSRWYENSLGIERGPLVYVLRVEEDWREVVNKAYDDSFREVLPKSPWNYGLLKSEVESGRLVAEISDKIADYPWNLENAPIKVKTRGVRIPSWQIDKGSAGRIPLVIPPVKTDDKQIEEISLIPYGCSTLRISQFPVVNTRK